MKTYAIGIDYGTLSARAILVETDTGKELASSVFEYPHGVMDEQLPDGTAVGSHTAYQHPQDYLDALQATVQEVLQSSGVDANAVVGLGIDFTACTMLPVDKDGTPLCFQKKFQSEPHAYAKLWKHHGAQAEADEITRLAKEEPWLDIYGGKVSSEWLFPKMLETLHKAPQVYHAAEKFLEAGDWLTMVLTGEDVRSSCMAGYKGMWNARDGYPSTAFLKQLAPEMEHIVGTKISTNVKPTGTKAGTICAAAAAMTGLSEKTAVAVPIIDAHAALPAAGIAQSGKLMLIIGTSSCHILLDEQDRSVPGICGRVQDGVLPGFVAYEAGQAAVGDIFDWFVKNQVPYTYMEQARKEQKDIFAFLTEKAEKLEIGESGLVALDWWNGNRTPYADADLKGVIYGYTLKTKPEELYRALIEATAFGTKEIVDLYARNGVQVDEIYATGGISQKNELLMQIYADVLGKTIRVPEIKQAGAMGSAIFAAYAGGAYETVQEAVQGMVNVEEKVYSPNLDNTQKYLPFYEKYNALSAFFAKHALG